MRKSLLLLVFCILAAASAAVSAQVGRLLPDNGERATTGERQPFPNVKLGRSILRLAPGGVIYDQQNRSIVHASLPVNAEVLVVRNQAGDVQRLYILTEAEQARLRNAGHR
jgi:hypothetical protein